MLGPESQGDTHQPWDFMDVYAKTGGCGQPIFTLKMYQHIRDQYDLLIKGREATIHTLWDKAITVTLRPDPNDQSFRVLKYQWVNGEGNEEASLRVAAKDRIQVGVSGVMALAYQIPLMAADAQMVPPHWSAEDFAKMENVNLFCPFFFKIFTHNEIKPFYTLNQLKPKLPEFEKAWKSPVKSPEESLKKSSKELPGESTKEPKDPLPTQLITALEKHAKEIRLVKKMVCFGLGSIQVYDPRAYVQHLAAYTIARKLDDIQASYEPTPEKIKIVAQDPMYTDTCKTILGKLDPPITFVDFQTFDALHDIDRNTFIVSIGATEIVAAPAIEIIGPDGPAGMLINEMKSNCEREWHCKPLRKDLTAPTTGWTTETEMLYKEQCICKKVTDDIIFGGKSRPKCWSWESGILKWVNGKLEREFDENGNPKTDGKPYVTIKAQTERLKRRRWTLSYS
jgi:hypothetical protein